MKTINDFISFSKSSDKTALIFKKEHKWIRKTFSELLSDIFKMNRMIQTEIKDDNILIFSHPYKYDFFVTAFSVILSGKNLVIIDSFKDKIKLKSMIESAKIKTVICDDTTKYFGFIFPKTIKKINAKKCYSNQPLEVIKNSGKIITFTSGTTGNPKLIERDIEFLFKQIEMIKNNINLTNSELVYALLPMYALMSLFLGNTTIINRDPGKIRKFKPTALITSIKSIKAIKNPINSVEHAFIGGAILYKKEAKIIKSKLPNSVTTYVYGASESAMICKTSIDKYIANPFTFDEKINGIEISISNKNSENIGEIIVSGDTVISNDEFHSTGDLGLLLNGTLTIVGRKKYSTNGFYNYMVDELVLSKNPKIKEAYSFVFNNKKYVIYSGKLTFREKEFIYKKFRKIPHDLKHKTKADYSKIIKILNLEKM